MYLRCSNCHAPTWIRTLVPGAAEKSIECGKCGRSHDLSNAEALGRDKKTQYQNANRFSEAHAVDLPTAYSILLGLMTLETARRADAEAREKARREAAPPPAAAPAAAPAARPAARPARQPGPAPGHAWAKKKARPRPRGDEDNVTVHVERDMAQARKQVTAGQAVLLVILAVLVLGLTGRHAYRTWTGMVEKGRIAEQNTIASAAALDSAEQKQDEEIARETGEEVSPLMRTTIERDAFGRLVRVTGTNPHAVLESYCKEGNDGSQRTPLGIAPASPPDAAERFGVFRDLADLQTDHAIRISRDRETRAWSAGDGRNPIATRPSPADAVTSSLRSR